MSQACRERFLGCRAASTISLLPSSVSSGRFSSSSPHRPVRFVD